MRKSRRSPGREPLIGQARLAELLASFPIVRVAVVGDFFLDRYLVTDPALEERSLETGQAARQVVARRSSPGHAGTVTNNLYALGVRTIYACGFTGDDGEGYELRRCLTERGVDTTHLISSTEVVTGTYVKPTIRQRDGAEHELERLDMRNRAPLPTALEDAIVAAVDRLTSGHSRQVDAVIVADQVDERNHGAIADRVRAALCRLAKERPAIVWYADSRQRIGEYRHVYAKPNRDECRRASAGTGLAVEMHDQHASDDRALAARLSQRTGKPVFLTLSEQGMLVITPAGDAYAVPPLLAPGPVDPTGAGDAATAGIVPALALGATPLEAAALGTLVSGLTVRQLNTTGTASPEDVLAAWREWAS